MTTRSRMIDHLRGPASDRESRGDLVVAAVSQSCCAPVDFGPCKVTRHRTTAQRIYRRHSDLLDEIAMVLSAGSCGATRPSQMAGTVRVVQSRFWRVSCHNRFSRNRPHPAPRRLRQEHVSCDDLQEDNQCKKDTSTRHRTGRSPPAGRHHRTGSPTLLGHPLRPDGSSGSTTVPSSMTPTNSPGHPTLRIRSMG
jgi:hypothetical protein